MQMWVYVVRRAALLIPVIIGVMTILFVLFSALPTSEKLQSVVPSSRYGYDHYIPCARLGLPGTTCVNPVYTLGAHILGLDKPIPVQYGIYLYNSFTFNWGTVNGGSQVAMLIGQTNGHPVAQVIAWLLPYTIELSILSLAIILLIAFPLGNYAAVYRNRPIDQGARVFSFAFYALPTFLFGILLILGAQAASGGYTTTCNGTSFPFQYFVGSWPKTTCLVPYNTVYPAWMPTGLATSPTGFPTVDAIYNALTAGNSVFCSAQPNGALLCVKQSTVDWNLAWQSVYRLVLPAVVIAFGTVALILRYVRNSMLEVLNLDFVRTARSKGAPESTVIRRHAGRNSLTVTVNVLGLTFAFFIGGFPIVELVFGLNGIGRLFAYSVLIPFDYAVIFGTTLLFTYIVVIANILVDVIVAYLDPRIRLG